MILAHIGPTNDQLPTLVASQLLLVLSSTETQKLVDPPTGETKQRAIPLPLQYRTTALRILKS